MPKRKSNKEYCKNFRLRKKQNEQEWKVYRARETMMNKQRRISKLGTDTDEQREKRRKERERKQAYRERKRGLKVKVVGGKGKHNIDLFYTFYF